MALLVTASVGKVDTTQEVSIMAEKVELVQLVLAEVEANELSVNSLKVATADQDFY